MFVSTLLVVVLAAPVPKAKTSDLYYPTVEGTKKVMQTKTGNQTTETTETVTKVVEKDGKYTVTTSRDMFGRTLTNDVEVSEKGVFRPASSGENAESSPLFKLPAKEGDTWTSEQKGPGNGNNTRITYTVGKEEEVEVPAGRFKAIPVIMEVSLLGRALKNTTWHAPGVGVVKIVSENNGTERVQELKEFTLGKAK